MIYIPRYLNLVYCREWSILLYFGCVALLFGGFGCAGGGSDGSDGPNCESNRDCTTALGRPVCDLAGEYGEPNTCVAASQLTALKPYVELELDVGETTPEMSFVIRNSGTAVLGPLELSVSDDALSIVLTSCVGYLMPGSECVVTAVLNARIAGLLNSRITVSDPSEQATIDVHATVYARVAVQPLGEGVPRVISEPAGIDCGELCSARFAISELTLRVPDHHAGVFAGWSGCVGEGATCTLTLDAPELTVYARFVDDLALWRSRFDADNTPHVAIATDGVVYVAASGSLHAFANNGTAKWSVNTAPEHIGGAAVDSAGNPIVAGWSANSICIQRYDWTGNIVWELGGNAVPGYRVPVVDVLVDVNDEIFVAGSVRGDSETNESDAWLRKYAVDGSELWTVTHDGPVSGNDHAMGIALDPTGNVLLAIHERLDENLVGFLSKTFDAEGELLSTAPGAFYGWGDFVFAGDSSLISARLVDISGTDSFALRVRARRPTGTIAWESTWGITQQYYYDGPVLAADDWGYVLAAGKVTNNGGGTDVSIRMLDWYGDVVWEDQYDGASAGGSVTVTSAAAGGTYFAFVGLEQGEGWLSVYR